MCDSTLSRGACENGRGGLRPLFEVVHRRFHERAANQVQPFLYFVFIFEARRLALTVGGEEDVQIELVEFALLGDLANGIGQLVGEQNHAREHGIRIVRAFPGSFRALLIRIRPVEDLLFDELARGDGAERRARQIEIGVGADGQKVFDLIGRLFQKLRALTFGVLDFGFIFRIEQVFGFIAPRAVVVFVQDHAVPMRGVHPFVLRLDAARGGIAAEIVLK